MKSTKIVLLFLIALMGIGLAGCKNGLFQRRNKAYHGPARLELNPLNAVVSGSGQIALKVQLIGHQRKTDLPVNFSVDDSSTARQGTDYTIATSSPVSIPADSSSAVITINANNSKIDSNKVRTLYLSLDNNNKVQPAVNLKTFTLTIRGPH
ncbi:MAG TPA: hypothetical protein VE868_08815 [Balneolaceae bacterium]|nr:hypothetical protein [Balneolaceae bacterium]